MNFEVRKAEKLRIPSIFETFQSPKNEKTFGFSRIFKTFRGPESEKSEGDARSAKSPDMRPEEAPI